MNLHGKMELGFKILVVLVLTCLVHAKKNKIANVTTTIANHTKTSKGLHKAFSSHLQKNKSIQGSKKQSVLGLPGYDNEKEAMGSFGGGGGIGGGLGNEMGGIPIGMGAGSEPLGFAGSNNGAPPQNLSPEEGGQLAPNTNSDDGQYYENGPPPSREPQGLPQEEESNEDNEHREEDGLPDDLPAGMQSKLDALQRDQSYQGNLPGLSAGGMEPNTIPAFSDENENQQPQAIPGLSNFHQTGRGESGPLPDEWGPRDSTESQQTEPSYLGTLMKNADAGLEQYNRQAEEAQEYNRQAQEDPAAHAIGKPIRIGFNGLPNEQTNEGRSFGDPFGGFRVPAPNFGATPMGGGQAMLGIQGFPGFQGGLQGFQGGLQGFQGGMKRGMKRHFKVKKKKSAKLNGLKKKTKSAKIA